MDKYIIDERNGFEYELKGDYYYPTGRRIIDGVLTPAEIPEDDEPDTECLIDVWAQRHLRYIRQHKKRLYLDLLLSGQVNDYLAAIDRQAEDMFLRSVKEMSAQEGVTEELKAEDQMLWVARMNNIRERVTETVNNELFFC